MRPFHLLPGLIRRSRNSIFWHALLNILLRWVIPFNRPHGFRVEYIGDGLVRTGAPYRRANLNHVKGIHACGIATVAEFSAGFLLLIELDPARYRLIMSKIEVDYLYQAKEPVVSESRLDKERLEREVTSPLQVSEAVSIEVESTIRDRSGNHVAQARTTWQIKRWDRVRTTL